jgi:hypothetical protein
LKRLFTYCVLVLGLTNSIAQTDTILINDSLNGSPALFGRTNWSTPKHYTQIDWINPNYDTIFWKIDSSLYTGYMKTQSYGFHYMDTSKVSSALYYVEEGIVSFLSRKTLCYLDDKDSRTNPWLLYEDYSTDSSIMSNKYYYSGLLWHQFEYFPDQKNRIMKLYDTSGTLTFISQKKNEVRDGENYIRLSNCCGLIIIYSEGTIISLESPSLLLFNGRSKRISLVEFVSLINLDSRYSWSHLVVEGDSQSDWHLLLYLFKNHKGLHYRDQGRGLNLSRKKQLLKKILKISDSKVLIK